MHKGADFFFHGAQVAAGEDGDEGVDFLGGFVPPFPFKQQGGQLVVKAPADFACGIAGGDGVGRDMAANDAASADDGAVANMLPRMVSPLSGRSSWAGGAMFQPCRV